MRSALARDRAPKYVRAPAGSAVDVVEPRIRELLKAYPRMPATVIAERIGWTRSIHTLGGRVAELRPVYLPADPASRTSYVAGEIGQCDLQLPPVRLPVGFGQVRKLGQLPVLTMIAGYSLWLSAVLIPSRRAEDLFAGWWQLIEGLGTCPRMLIWDGEGAIGRWRPGKPSPQVFIAWAAARHAVWSMLVIGSPRTKMWERLLHQVSLLRLAPHSPRSGVSAPAPVWAVAATGR